MARQREPLRLELAEPETPPLDSAALRIGQLSKLIAEPPFSNHWVTCMRNVLQSLAIVMLVASMVAAQDKQVTKHRVSPIALDKGRGWSMGTNSQADGGLLPRELARQAFLIAARDEMGRSTRDIWL